jgi:DNA-binding transcriptional ArsR family regulator
LNKKKLLSKTEQGLIAKDIVMFKDPEKMKPMFHKTRWQILQHLAERPKFAAELAREMGLHEQKVYYHLRQLTKANLIKVDHEEEIRGAKAKFYTVVGKAYGIELLKDTATQTFSPGIEIDERLAAFFAEFAKNSTFDGLIVVGSPEAHGPHKTWARDGHYANYLSMFLGQMVKPSDKLFVKLDVEVRAEKALDNNLILVGGPAVNLVTKDINAKLKQPAFDNHIQGIAPQAIFGRGITSAKPDTFYSQNNVGIVFKTSNPFNQKKTVLAFAGQGRRGTKAAILALTNNWEKLLVGYTGGSFRKVVEGFDFDGDGMVDSVEILE